MSSFTLQSPDLVGLPDVTFSDDGTRLAWFYRHVGYVVVDVATAELVKEIRHDVSFGIHPRFSPDTSRLIGGVKSLRIWSLDTGRKAVKLPGCTDCHWLSDATVLTCGDDHITIRDTQTGAQGLQLSFPWAMSRELALAPDATGFTMLSHTAWDQPWVVRRFALDGTEQWRTELPATPSPTGSHRWFDAHTVLVSTDVVHALDADTGEAAPWPLAFACMPLADDVILESESRHEVIRIRTSEGFQELDDRGHRARRLADGRIASFSPSKGEAYIWPSPV